MKNDRGMNMIKKTFKMYIHLVIKKLKRLFKKTIKMKKKIKMFKKFISHEINEIVAKNTIRNC